jgi:hypothetical protein
MEQKGIPSAVKFSWHDCRAGRVVELQIAVTGHPDVQTISLPAPLGVSEAEFLDAATKKVQSVLLPNILGISEDSRRRHLVQAILHSLYRAAAVNGPGPAPAAVELPDWLEWQSRSPHRDREAILGDLTEAFEERLRSEALWTARAWLVGRIVYILIYYRAYRPLLRVLRSATKRIRIN